MSVSDGNQQSGYVLVRTLPTGKTEVYRGFVRCDGYYARAIQIFATADKAESAAVRYNGGTTASNRETAADRGWRAVEAVLQIR
jgi:hypothetical protein